MVGSQSYENWSLVVGYLATVQAKIKRLKPHSCFHGMYNSIDFMKCMIRQRYLKKE